MSQTTLTILNTMSLDGDVYSGGSVLEMPSSSLFGNRLRRALAPVQLIDSEVITAISKTQFKISGDITLEVGNYLLRKNDQFIADLEAIVDEGPVIFDLDPVGVFVMDQTYTSKLSIAQVNLAMYTQMTKQITFKVLWEDAPTAWKMSDLIFTSPIASVDPIPVDLGGGLWALNVTSAAAVGETVVSFHVTADGVMKTANLQVRISEPDALVFQRFNEDDLPPNTNNQIYFTLKQSGLPVTDFTNTHVTVRSPQLPISAYSNLVTPGVNPGEYYLSLSSNWIGGAAYVSFNGFIGGRLYTLPDFVVTADSAPVTMTVLGDPLILNVAQDVQFTLTQSGKPLGKGSFSTWTGGTTPVLVDASTGTWKTTTTGTAVGTLLFSGSLRVEEQPGEFQAYPVSGSTTVIDIPLGELGFTQVTTRLDVNLVQFVRFNLTVDGVAISDATTNKITVVTSSLSTYAQTLVLDDATTGAYHLQVATNATPGNVKISLKINHGGNVYTVPDFNLTVAVGG